MPPPSKDWRLALAALLGGCGDPEPLSRADACGEQADNWCGVGGTAADNCARQYVSWCTADTDADVEVDDQDACLDALAAMDPPWNWWTVPVVCREMWRAL